MTYAATGFKNAGSMSGQVDNFGANTIETSGLGNFGSVKIAGTPVVAGVVASLPGTAITQTYSTADTTNPAMTAATLTVADGAGTNDGTIGAITADASVIAAVQELAAQINKLVADVLANKKLINQIVDDLQVAGIET